MHARPHKEYECLTYVQFSKVASSGIFDIYQLGRISWINVAFCHKLGEKGEIRRRPVSEQVGLKMEY